MAHVIEDRVQETSTTTGTGAFTLAGAVTGFRAFSAVCSTSDTVPYIIEEVDAFGFPDGDWETGIGTYSAANTLTRTTVLASSNAGAAVNFAAGDKRVAIGPLAVNARWTQIGSTATPSGVSSVEFNDIPASYSELVLVCEGLSHNFDNNTALRVNFSDNGTNWTGDYTWGTAASAAVAWYGGLHIPHYTAPAGMAASTVTDLSSNNSLGTRSGTPAWRCAGGVTDIRVKVNGGNFDAGTLKLYGR